MKMRNPFSCCTSGAKGKKKTEPCTTPVSALVRTTFLAVVAIAVFIPIMPRTPFLLQSFDGFLTSLQETKKHLANHIYLHGNYAPVADEHMDPVPLEVVQGALPNDLDGLFVRNGPNPVPAHISKRYHWFDGHGMLHNVRIRPSTGATYTNMYVPTPRYLIEKKLGAEYFGRFGEMKGWVGLIKTFTTFYPLLKSFGLNSMTMGQANTHTIMFQNKFYCGHEASLPFELQLDDHGRIVKALGFDDFRGQLNYPVSAHPKKDPVTGNLLFHCYAVDPALIKRDGFIKVGEYDATSQQLVSYVGVKAPRDNPLRSSFAHDLMFTKNWIVIFDSSVQFDETKILSRNESVLAFTRHVPMRIGLIPRQQGISSTPMGNDQVVWINSGAPHVLIHPLNAWEDENDGSVVLWSPSSMKLIDTNYNVEFPRIRDDCLGRFCRFGYAGIMDPTLGGDAQFSGFTVWDMEEGRLHKAVKYPDGDIGGEPVVIPKSGRNESNAVYLGTFIYNSNDKQSYFVLYDGENDNDLVVKWRVPYCVPFGFHGQWVTGDELRAHVEYHEKM